MAKYILSCESTVDLPNDYVLGRGISIIYYTYTANGQVYVDDMKEDSLKRFYKWLDEGIIPATSQLNQYQYEEYFRSLLSKGDNVLHICFGTGMTQSYNNALLAEKTMRTEFPDQDLIVIDSTCSSSGYGLFVDDIKDMLDKNTPIESIVHWIYDNRLCIHHQFFSTDLKYFRRTGRMSGPVAFLASTLNICPIMHLNKEGKIIAYSKVMGERAAVKKTIDTMVEHCDNGLDYQGKVFISHSNDLEHAEMTKEALLSKFHNLKESDIRINSIGTIIASHAGPGTVAIFFHGDERQE